MEFLAEFIIKYWLECLFGLFLGGVSYGIKYAWGNIKRDYLTPIKENQQEIINLKDNIDQKFSNIEKRITDMEQMSRANDLAIIRDSLLRKLRHGLQAEDKCISFADFETVSALLTQYEELGGNGEVHKLYKRYEKLHICPEHDYHHDFHVEEQ